MEKEKKFGKIAWKIMVVLSAIFLVWTLFVMSRGTKILPTAFKLAGSTQLTDDIEKSALDFMNMSMLKPLWEGLWAGIFGLFIAFGLKRREKYAWTLGLFWGIMMLTNAAIQGGYEIIILGWSNVCLQTYMFLFLGISAFITFIITRRYFIKQ
jgi:hypothetical protein